MENSAWWLRLMWGVLFASLLLWPAMPYVLPPRADSWYEAQTAVAGFVLALFALVTAVASFAMRESLVRDVERRPAGAEGGVWVRVRLGSLWLLCALVGVYGGIMMRYAGASAVGWPYLALAVALFVVHAPRAAFLRRVQVLAPTQRG